MHDSGIVVLPGKLHGVINVPQSKSIAHRAIICSALARNFVKESISDRFEKPEKSEKPDSVDTGNEDAISDDIALTRRAIGDLLMGSRVISCGESGSTLRFMIPIAAALGADVVFTGRGRLPLRPLREFQEAFNGKEITMEFPDEQDTYLPLHINGKLKPGLFSIPGNISSQYISGLLLALPLLDGDSQIHITTSLESKSYIDLTIEVMKQFGIKVYSAHSGFDVPGNQTYKDTDFLVEGDYSQAAFWLTANFLGSSLTLTNLSAKSLQGDKEIVSILERLSHASETNEEVVIDASQIPDLVPIICVAAANTPCVTRIYNAGRLRLKESDRISSSADLINSIGGNAKPTQDGIIIVGHSECLRGGVAHSRGDHRIAMAATIAGTASIEGITIDEPSCVKKSYPRFFDDFKAVKGVMYGIDIR